MRYLIAGLIVGMAAPTGVEAQNSVYGVRGAGFPGRPISVQARGMGGGMAMFDRLSALNPATVGGLPSLRVNATYGTTFRNYRAEGSQVSGLVESRFPQAMVGGGIGRSPYSFAIGYSTYAERSFDVTREDTITVRNAQVGVSDRLSSRGGIVDVRGAVAYRASTRLHIGGALHVINGSARVSANREFSDQDLRSYSETSNLSFSGIGFSAGAVMNFSQRRVVLGAVLRKDSRLTQTVNDRTSQGTSLPFLVGLGANLTVTNRLQWATTATWRSWGSATTTTGTFAFDTWDVASGVEVTSGLGTLPLRVGARYGTLPFGPVASQPYEYGFAAGTGFIFAQGRGELDFSLERIARGGGGASERGWHFTMGISVQP